MVDKFVTFVAKIIFGKDYLDGYIEEPEKKEDYRLVSLFPNEIARDKATSVLGKGV